jgi:hypothetical protein
MGWFFIVVTLISGSWRVHTETYATQAVCEAHAARTVATVVVPCAPWR